MDRIKLHKYLWDIMIMAHDETKKEFPILNAEGSEEFNNYYNNFWYPLRNEIPKIKKPVQFINLASKLNNDKITNKTFIYLVDYLLCY